GQNVKHDESQTCEVLARTAIHEKDYNFETLLEISSSLKLGHIAGHRMATSAEAGSSLGTIGGLWVHGGVHGLTKTCSTIPWVIKYINKFARHHGVQGWTSFSLTKNLLTNVHRDPNNLAGYDSVTTSFGNFSGGELWTHDDHQEDNKETVWRNGLPGTTVTTRERLVAFDSREPHATQPWTGERWCLTWYTSRAVLKTTLEERDELRALGFPMNSLANTKRSTGTSPGVGEFIRWPEKRRPRKSTRTQLWKMAKRLSSFATWSILATTTFLGNAVMTTAFDEPAPTINLMHHNNPVLFEIGGWDQTMEATAKGIEAVEPMVDLDLHDPPTLTRIKDILEELKPRTLWIHGDHFGDPVGLDEVIELQRNIGGNVTVEGKLNGPMWSSNFGTFLYQMPGVTTYRSNDLLRAQFGGRDHALCEREDDMVFDSTTAEVLLRNYLEEKNDQGTTRQVFPVEAEPRGGARQGNEPSSSRGASAISFRDPQPRPEVASSLRRLHQNLGHPAISDLTRHLRLAGAGPEVVAAAKNMTCEVCRRAQQGKSPKPATLPTTTSFNEIIGVDAFTVYDCQGKKLEMFSVYDYGTSYHIVGELPGHSTEAMEQALCDLWTKVFGPPRTILVDLETGLQAGLERYSAWFGTRVRSAAGQAPWQVGAVERHGGVWKHMWKKVVDEHSILKESPGDIKMGITAINAAKNELRRQGGFSPTQAVYGRDPDVPGELLDHRDPQQTDEILTRDQLRAREQVLRQAARIAYHRAQVDSRLRRALLQRSRVSGEDLNPGDVVYFLRKPKNKKDWRWVGPATVVGHEKKNLWVASAGRCHLVAPEHVRKATSEEVGDLFTLCATQDDLQRLLDQEPGDPQAYDYPENTLEDTGENVDEDLVLPPGDDMNKDLLSEVIFDDEEMPMEGERRRGPPGDPPVVLNKRYRTKGPETAFVAKSVRFNLEPEELEPKSTSSRESATIQKGILMNFRDNAEITVENLDDHYNYAYMVRSTFAAESMGCCGAIENADFIRKFLSMLLTGDLCRHTSSSDAEKKDPENAIMEPMTVATQLDPEGTILQMEQPDLGRRCDDLGASARSYLRQVAAWRKMTRLSADQHGLVLYQNLSGKAWIDAERLDVDLLGMDTGAEYFINWIKERYLDVQITQIGRGLSDFFRRLRRKDGQTIREYLSDFDRALARLTECGCVLPDMASAWVFVDRMSPEESAELNLLASVGNEYNLKRLQQAAIVQDRSLRKPWESSTRSASRDSAAPGRGPRREWWNKKTNTAHLTGHGDNEDDDYPEADPVAENAVEDIVPEAVAEEWYETFMTHETAKQKYRDSLRQRGTNTEALREIANDRLAQAKAKSFCAGCKRRGHWHKDSCCPLNQGARKQGEQSGGNATTSPSQNTTTPARTSYQCSVVYVTWDLDKPVASTQLLAIADTACSKSAMGAGWLDSYLKETAKIDYKPQFLNVNENFKFGASRVDEASYAVIVTFALKGVVVQAKVAVVHGDVPLLLSRGALAKLGTVLDIAANTADFKFINVKGFPLKITDTGHPAVPFVPIRPPEPLEPRKDWAGEDLMILSSERAYTGVAVLPHAVPAVHSVHVSSTCSKGNPHQLENSQGPEDHLDDNLNSKNPQCERIFYPKKIGKAILNMLTADMLCTEAFMTWWLQTNVSNDFWIETPNLLVRVHVIPRRHFFTPAGWKDGGHLKNKLLENLGALDLCKAFQPRLDMSARASTGQTPLPRPATGSKSIWKWNKQELVNEALRVGITIHPKWTVPEIRSVIMEHRAQTSNAVEDATPKRLGSMTLEELKTTAAEHNINLPTRVTRGQAMRLIRDATEDLSHKVMTFGRYRGWTFADTPEGYQEWAIAEVERSSNASEDLRMYANWARNKNTTVMSSVTYDASLDPEFNASTPYEPTESDMMSWRMVSHGPPEDKWRAVTHGYANERTLTPGTASTPKAKAKVPPRAQ
ncbi:GIP, partial [Symbiodinium necroappetens]